MDRSKVNWRDFESALGYAKFIAMRAPIVRLVLYWDGERYHLTHQGNIARVIARANRVVAFIGGDDEQERPH